LHFSGRNVRHTWHGLQLALGGYTAANLGDRSAAIAAQSSLVTVTNGAGYWTPSLQTDGDLRRPPSAMCRSHRRDDESLVLDSNPNAFSYLESRILKPYSRQFDPREIVVVNSFRTLS